MPKSGSDTPSAAVTAQEVAAQIVAAIERDQLYLATNSGSAAAVQLRVDRLVAETRAPLPA